MKDKNVYSLNYYADDHSKIGDIHTALYSKKDRRIVWKKQRPLLTAIISS